MLRIFGPAQGASDRRNTESCVSVQAVCDSDDIMKRVEEECGPPGVEWETASCVLCGSGEGRVVLAAADLLFGFPGRFQLVRCAGCGHHYVNPRPTRDTIGLFYPDDYGPHRDHQPPAQAESIPSPAESPADRSWYLSSPVRHIPGLRRLYYWLTESQSEIIPESVCQHPRGLEVGCGSGRFLDQLQASGWEAEGIEPAEAPARRCQERGLNVHIGDLESVKLDAGQFDVVFAWMVVEHLHDPEAALREMRRLLKSDGKLLFSVPNFGCWESRVFGEYSYSLQLPIHLHQFTPRTIRRLLRQNGFRLERLIHQPNLLNVVGSIGLWMSRKFPKSGWGPQWVQFTNQPSMWGSLALAVPAKLLAALHQGGRLSVIATPDETWTEGGRSVGMRSPMQL
ncbi:MAG: class I SAM-dependent methyltransferase [Planctomycetaceae bacterium]